VLGFVEVLVAELEAGQPPAGAVRSAAERSAEDPLFRAVLQHLLLGTDPVTAVRTAAQRPGADDLWPVAVCLDVASTSGAGLAQALRPLAAGIRDDRELGREVDGQLAGPRSSARLLASLPVVVWGLGLLLGANPLQVLLTTPYGLGCLGVGVALEVAGLTWVAAMARAAVGR
jgi:tight adherence protein B